MDRAFNNFHALFFAMLASFSHGGHNDNNHQQTQYREERNTENNDDKQKNIIYAHDSLSAVGQTVSIDMNFPRKGGVVTGKVTGACNGNIRGGYSGGTTGTLSGTVKVVCPIIWGSFNGNGSFTGNVNLDNSTSPMTYHVTGNGVDQSGTTTFTFSK
jgi:hypothetical protein